MMTPEQLREQWKTLKAPGCFNPNEPNWTDLSVQEVGESLGNTLGKGVFGATYYDRYQRVNRDELPYTAAAYYPSTSLAEIFNDWEQSSQVRNALPFLDPEDRVYYKQPLISRYIMIQHLGSLVSDFWEGYWGLQVDTAVKVRDFIGEEEKARSLVPPQRVRSQLRSPVYPELYIINRESLEPQHTWRANESRKAILVDEWLLYSKFLLVPRKGDYPFSDDVKSKVVQAAAEVIAKDTHYEDTYRQGLENVYHYARSNGIELAGIFAAREE